MAEKTEGTEKTGAEQEPDFTGVIFEGEDGVEGGVASTGGDGEGDERLGEREGVAAHEGTPGETDEQKRERRRQERQAKKRVAREQRDENKTLKAELARLAREMSELRGGVEQRVGTVEGRQDQTRLQLIDSRLATLRSLYATAQANREKAMTEGNGAAFNQADQELRDYYTEYQRLGENRKALTAPRQVQQPQDEDRPDPRVARRVNAFIAEFPDYDPAGRDADSKVVQALDEALTEEGYDPTTADYWDELRERVLDRIPEWGDTPQQQRQAPRRAANGNGSRPRPRQTIAGGGGGDGGGEGSGYRISAERVQAMKEAGMWDDHKKRARMVERFKQYDREQRRSA